MGEMGASATPAIYYLDEQGVCSSIRARLVPRR